MAKSYFLLKSKPVTQSIYQQKNPVPLILKWNYIDEYFPKLQFFHSQIFIFYLSIGSESTFSSQQGHSWHTGFFT